MEQLAKHLSEATVETLRQAIAEAGGNEVVFVGQVDERGRVFQVEPIARGNLEAAPVVLSRLGPGEVVLHNHPGGELTPSHQDLELASRLANERGCGFLIVDNEVTRVYAVVAPLPKRTQTSLDLARLTALLAPDGRIATALPGYEHRPEQVHMLEEVVQAYNHDSMAVIEAGTGTGKSLAYLVPSIIWAATNRERVVIATRTITLQEQLLHKDLPFLRECLGYDFKAVLVKGQANYLCLKKLESLHRGAWLPGLRPDLERLSAWAERTTDGSTADLDHDAPTELWDEVSVELDLCPRLRCPHYQRCFYFSARREAASADLLLINHHLLFADLSLRNRGPAGASLLPGYTKLVLDEAHHLEEVASEFLGGEVGNLWLQRLLRRLYHQGQRYPSVLAQITVQVKSCPALPLALADRLGELLEVELPDLHRELVDLVAELVDGTLTCLGTPGSGNSKALKLRLREEDFERPELQQAAIRPATTLLVACAAFRRGAERLVETLGEAPERLKEDLIFPLQILAALTLRLERALDTLCELLTPGENDQVRWIELEQRRTGFSLAFRGAPLAVGEALTEQLYQRTASTIFTSATLSTERTFAFFRERVGLDRYTEPRLCERLIGSPFAYREQVLLGVPSDLPSPKAPGHLAALTRAVKELCLATGGGTFVLFTSREQLDAVHRAVQAELTEAGLQLFRQGELRRFQLLTAFKATPGAVLFGTDSFWEGVDVEGDALRAVLIARLPFRVPTEPLLQARVEDLERRGEDAFTRYTVPQAIIRFKQGFGRLIRKKDDRGVVVILDSRVLGRSYGQAFLSSLPETGRCFAPQEKVVAEVRRFLKR
ncbi:MAG: hypothetical protein A2284_15730 [Deltaproteobacteria bacterium RIFOXYA12_FULL_61_11]|nr:MAG: hypothetical protein A2284_15730 [Deltaproteobacteria bacterium RIFOXYA12_FULL_61_11]